MAHTLLAKKRIALFASGAGSNAENIARYFKNHPNVEVALILSNKPDAYVLERAKHLDIKTVVFNREAFYQSQQVIDILHQHNIDFIVLAGFLWLVPASLTEAFANRIVNIHPALLPKYGGKGMFGQKVHEAVVANAEPYSGITIHYVNHLYDEGQIIFQAKCPLLSTDTATDVAQKVHALEYEHYPRVIESLLG